MPSGGKLFFIEGGKFGQWLRKLMEEQAVFAPVERAGAPGGKPDYAFSPLGSPEEFRFNPYRCLEPLKGFFTPYSEKVAEYFGAQRPAQSGKTAVFGVKACDLAAHRVQDYIFLEGVEQDNFYKMRRDAVTIISSDCTDFREVCFCMSMGGAPYPSEGFDINLSPDKGGYIAETGSPAGEELIGRSGDLFDEADEKASAGRDEGRKRILDGLGKHLAGQDLPRPEELQPLVKGGFESGVWGEFAETCVECGACNFACDTCHCFLLSEGASAGAATGTKTRLWDSCQYRNFARVAGGGNPMRSRAERLRNRFLKKFDFFVDNMNSPACCGCGRCIESCPAEIDIREVLKALRKDTAEMAADK